MKNSQAICTQLIEAESEQTVGKVLSQHEAFSNEDNWLPYGGVSNNFGVISNQQSDGIDAMVEKIVNSMDALLTRKCWEMGIDPEGKMAPDSVRKAAEKFFSVPDGNIANIGEQDIIRTLADHSYVVSSGSRSQPNYAIIDRGEGQHPQNFPDTFLSLQKSNKMKIPFVQGKFNMGGSGVLMFCGDKHYQLIVSRKHPNLVEDGENPWGWTLVRKRPPQNGEKSPVYVYFAPDGEIPTFEANTIPVLPDKEGNARGRGLDGGSYIKLYDYKGVPSTIVTTSLYRRLNLRLFHIPVPVTLHEGRDYQSHTKHAYLEGMRSRMESRQFRDEILVKPAFPIDSEIKITEGNHAKVRIWLLNQKVKRSRWLRPSEGVNFTINGQTHASWDRRFFSRKSVKKDYLKNNLLVEVDCTDLSSELISEMFMGSRDRLRNIDETVLMEDALEELIANDPVLSEYNQKWREEQVRKSFEDPKKTEDILRNLMAASPEISKLLGKKGKLPDPFDRGPERKEYSGEKFPTFLDLKKPDNGILEVPANTFRTAVFSTDVENGYFSRPSKPGQLNLTSKDWVKSVSLRDGDLRVQVESPEGKSVGDETVIQVALSTPAVDEGEIVREFRVVITEPAEKKKSDSKPNDKKHTNSVNIPLIQGIREPDWPLFNWDKTSVAEVHTHEMGTDVFVNIDNEHLRRTLSDREYANRSEEIENMFRIGIGILSFALNNNLPEDTPDETVNQVLKTLAMAWLPSVLKLTKIV